jgi:hypothetical protein
MQLGVIVVIIVSSNIAITQGHEIGMKTKIAADGYGNIDQEEKTASVNQRKIFTHLLLIWVALTKVCASNEHSGRQIITLLYFLIF